MKKIIKAARHKKNLTQKQLGKIIGYDETYISKLENGNKGFFPGSDAIAAIAKTLEIDPELLVIASGRPPERYRPVLQRHPAEMVELFQQLASDPSFIKTILPRSDR